MDSNKPALTGVKKRQQIQQANKAVFMWVAIAGVIVTIAVVLSQFMIKQLLFNLEIINRQTKTNSTLVQNAAAYTPLRTEVSKLISNKELTELRVNKGDNGDNALQVVIDAMPTADDRLGLAASIQQSVLSKSGIRVELLSFPESALPTTETPTTTSTTGVSEVTFTFKANGTYDQLKKMLEDIHLSIRPISVTGLKLSGESSNMTAEVQAKTYYATPPTTDLKKETLKP